MELRQLQCFLAVAEELNFSRAAERLNMTQPPLSMQIQNLERELGFPLLYRSNRRVELTAAGRQYYTEVKQILKSLSRAGEQAKRAHRGEIGTLTVGFVGSATYDILPAVLRDFRSLYPDVQVQLHEMPTHAQVEALHQKRIDIGVLRPPVADRAIHTDTIVASPCVLAVPKLHPLTDRPVLSVSDLSSYPFVMLSRRTWAGLYDEILALCSPVIRQEALEFQTVIGLVAAGLGIAVVPQSAASLHTQDVAYLEVEGLPVAEMGISWRAENRSPLVSAFASLALSKQM